MTPQYHWPSTKMIAVPNSWKNNQNKTEIVLPERGGFVRVPFTHSKALPTKNYGRPVKKASRHGKRGLNKCGHRGNPHAK